MKRPLGVTILALAYFLIALGWSVLFVIVAGELFKEFAKPAPWGLTFLIFFLPWCLLCALLSLASGFGLWRLRRWGRILVATVAGLISVAFLADFLLWTTVTTRDVITQWDSFSRAYRDLFLLPYHLVSWPIWEASRGLFPDSEFASYYAEFIVSYVVVIVGYAGIARYMVSKRVKQAFSPAP